MNVRISDTGRKILNNRKLSSQIARAIMEGRVNLEKGNPINVKNDDGKKMGSIELVTSIKESANSREH